MQDEIGIKVQISYFHFKGEQKDVSSAQTFQLLFSSGKFMGKTLNAAQ